MWVLALLAGLVGLVAPRAAHAAEPWWQPLGFAGQRVASVNVSGSLLIVTTSTAAYVSTDHGRTFMRSGPPADARELPAPRDWTIVDGRVEVRHNGTAASRDPAAPYLGAGAGLIAAPASTPGVVVAVGSDNHVWRRTATGRWATSFIPLPAGGFAGAPRVTSVAAFDTRPLSDAVYIGTDGYGVLVTEDGGADWIRADPGLPGSVLGLATDPAAAALYAATDRGLFVHHLQALPAPPVYRDASLYIRWLGIVLVALVAAGAALAALRRALPG